jgi:uncharacterized glyoxalase superfamily protein PhnB
MGFYTEALGFSLEWSDGKNMAMLKLRGLRLLIHPTKRKPPQRESPLHLHLEVVDVDGFHERLKGAGIKVPGSPKTMSWGHRTFRTYDPNGVEWEFYKRVRGRAGSKK